MSSSSKSYDFDENGWIVEIRRNLDEELEEESEIPVSIFNVPKPLLVSSPDSYIPQQIAIGPYHYFSPERHEMERYKIAAAKRIQKEHQTLKFYHAVEQLRKYESRIRAHYHRYLNVNGETLAWMMAVDASFLLEFLQVYAAKELGKVLIRVSSRMSHFIDSVGTKSAYNTILRDIVMVENQIPLFLLRKVLEFRFSSLELADELLISMLMGFYKELSPFKAVAEELPNNVQLSKIAHLLDFLYQMIVPKFEGSSQITTDEFEDQDEVKDDDEGKRIEKSSNVQKLLDLLWETASKLDKGPVRTIKRLLISKPFELMSKLPWTIISNFPGIKMFKNPLENIFYTQEKDEDAGKEEKENSKSISKINKPPLVEEITIPSVIELYRAGVQFVPTNAGMSSISFDVETATFYLPKISLDVNSEVILRNLVAYEACNASGPMVLARYTELMNGIIDTDEDAKFLRKKGIILNHLKKDEEVAKLWNGMSRSIKLTKVEFLDKVIGDVNKYYNCRWKVKVKKFMKRYVFGSWQVLTLLAAILMLFLMSVQAFCSVYNCPRMLNRVPNVH